MTARELNQAIKRLGKEFKKAETIEQVESLKDEFLRLYNADNKGEYLNLQSLKTMMCINRTYRFVQLHMFYIQMEY